MNSTVTERYRDYRTKNPLIPAKYAISWAKTSSDASEGWSADSHDGVWKREVDGFEIFLRVNETSIFPIPDRRGRTDYGVYVDAVRASSDDYDWGGNFPRPTESAGFTLRDETPSGIRRREIRIPYTSIRYNGPGWVQGEEGGYFIPDGISEVFDGYRHVNGQSRAVAWDLTQEWVESQISMLFHSPLTNCTVIVEAWREGVELARTVMGTDVSGDDEGRAYIFEMVAEHGMVEEVIGEAREVIERLTAADL